LFVIEYTEISLLKQIKRLNSCP